MEKKINEDYVIANIGIHQGIMVIDYSRSCRRKTDDDKRQIECYNCNKLGYFSWECKNKVEENVIYTKEENNSEPT